MSDDTPKPRRKRMTDGYPTPSELKAIARFHGTPLEFARYVISIWRNGGGTRLELVDSEYGNGQEYMLTLVTGGWSGCEEIISIVEKTMFSFAFHSSWSRGGLYEYRIPTAFTSAGDFGRLTTTPSAIADAASIDRFVARFEHDAMDTGWQSSRTLLDRMRFAADEIRGAATPLSLLEKAVKA